MAWNAEEIERIVRRIVAEMQAQSAGAPPSESAFVVESKVVSLAQLDVRLGAARRIRVRRDAVITPSARDWLREKQVTVESADVTPRPTQPSSRVVVGVADTKFDPTATLRAAELVNAQRLANSGLTSVVHELCDEVAKNGSVAVLFTRSTAAAMCLANRHRGVRAIEASDLKTMAMRMSAVGANLLVVDPQGLGTVALRQLVEKFCGGELGCPESLQKYLG